ncbi:MAG: tetratricopeptide repeat protein, partial [Gemmatimonadota bacterium]
LYVALTLAAAAALAGRAVALGTPFGHDVPAAFLPDDAFVTRLFTMMRVWPHYLRLLLAPLDLSPDYSPAVILPTSSLTLLGGLGTLVVILLLALAVAAWRRAPLVSAGIVWVPLSLLPVSNLLFTSGIVLAERTLYLASAGVSLAAAGLVPHLASWSGARRRIAAAAIAAALGALATRTVVQNPLWADTRTLFGAALRDHPESYKVHWVLGYDAATREDFASAFAHYRDAVLLWPHDPRLWSELAAQYVRVDAYASAEAAARRAVALDSTYPNAHQFLVLALTRQQRWDDAAGAARRGLDAAGADPLLYYLLSRALEALDRPGPAADALRRHLALQHADWAAWVYLAGLYGRAADTAAALSALDTAAARLDPAEPRAAEAVEALRRRLAPDR